MTDHLNQFDFTELVLLILQGDIAQDQITQLDQILKTEPDKVRKYVELMELYTELSPQGSVEITSSPDDSSVYDNLMNLLAHEEKTAQAIEIPETDESKTETHKPIETQRDRIKVSKLSIYSLILSSAALFFMLVYAYLAPDTTCVEVATLTDSIHVQWADTSISFQNGDRLSTNELLTLSKGILQIQTDLGVTLTIEGPAEFEMNKEVNLNLSYGRVYARVSKQGIGFTINTENSKIIDLGTEFGVQADQNGQTELHVLKGKTMLVSGSSWLDKISQSVSQNQARQISTDGTQVKSIPVRQDTFIRNINSQSGSTWRGQPINLADIVSGGNGLGSGKIQHVIDPDIGQYSSQVIHERSINDYGAFISNNTFNPVFENRFIDGVFVPAESPPFPISSKGHLFSDCPVTSGGNFFNICDTSKTPESYVSGAGVRNFWLAGENYSSMVGKMGIIMHSNSGITFDLNQIRSINPAELTLFSAVYGFPSGAKGGPRNKADVWVLIDGKIRHQHRGLYRDSIERKIYVEIREQDRFLTLVVTDHDKHGKHDWVLFGMPELSYQQRNDF